MDGSYIVRFTVRKQLLGLSSSGQNKAGGMIPLWNIIHLLLQALVFDLQGVQLAA